MTTDEAELAKLDRPGSSREYTLPRDDDLFKAKGWIRGNTKIGTILEVTVKITRSESTLYWATDLNPGL